MAAGAAGDGRGDRERRGGLPSRPADSSSRRDRWAERPTRGGRAGGCRAPTPWATAATRRRSSSRRWRPLPEGPHRARRRASATTTSAPPTSHTTTRPGRGWCGGGGAHGATKSHGDDATVSRGQRRADGGRHPSDSHGGMMMMGDGCVQGPLPLTSDRRLWAP